MIRRFARVHWQGASRWIECLDSGASLLLAGSTPPHNAEPVQEISAEETKGLTRLAPFSGTKILGLALNFRSLVGDREHYEEPLFFLKSPSSACPAGSVIPYPSFSDRVWVEVELAVVIGGRCREVTAEEAAGYIFGVTVAADVTARNVAGRDHHLGRSKAIDGFAPMGPLVVRGVDTSDLAMSTEINGVGFQSGTTSDRILDDAESVSLVSQFVTLEPGDVILTGTPARAMESIVGPGDEISQVIEDIGQLTYTIG